MLEFTAYLAAQHQTRELAQNARPDAPLYADSRAERIKRQQVLARQRLSLALRRLADMVEPAPTRTDPMIAGCR